LVLVLRGGVESAVAAALARLGEGLGVLKVFTRGTETILWVDAPLGHEVHRWLNEHGQLIWFNYRGAA